MRRLQSILDELITGWLRRVVDLREPVQPNLWPAQAGYSPIEFRIVTPAVQRQIDQSA